MKHASNKRLFLCKAGLLVVFAVCAHSPGIYGQSECASQAGLKQTLVMAEADGIVHVPPFDLPLSVNMGAEAKKALLERLRSSSSEPSTFSRKNIPKLRETVNAFLTPLIKRLQVTYPVNIEQRSISGIHTVIVTPKAGVADRNRNIVLISNPDLPESFGADNIIVKFFGGHLGLSSEGVTGRAIMPSSALSPGL